MRRALLAIRSLRWLSVEIGRTATLRTHQVSQAVFGSVSARHEDLKDRDHTGVLYIGLGDQFDDDRRLVREAASALTRQYVPRGLVQPERQGTKGSHGPT
jgi:hypothetical protein